jgi:hypothetical protein
LVLESFDAFPGVVHNGESAIHKIIHKYQTPNLNLRAELISQEEYLNTTLADGSSQSFTLSSAEEENRRPRVVASKLKPKKRISLLKNDS